MKKKRPPLDRVGNVDVSPPRPKDAEPDGTGRSSAPDVPIDESAARVIRFYHLTTTERAAEIGRAGFRDGDGAYMADTLLKDVPLSDRPPNTEGVWLSDRPLDATGIDTVLLAVHIDAARIEPFERVEFKVEAYPTYCLGSLVPAAIVNEHGSRPEPEIVRPHQIAQQGQPAAVLRSLRDQFWKDLIEACRPKRARGLAPHLRSALKIIDGSPWWRNLTRKSKDHEIAVAISEETGAAQNVATNKAPVELKVLVITALASRVWVRLKDRAIEEERSRKAFLEVTQSRLSAFDSAQLKELRNDVKPSFKDQLEQLRLDDPQLAEIIKDRRDGETQKALAERHEMTHRTFERRLKEAKTRARKRRRTDA